MGGFLSSARFAKKNCYGTSISIIEWQPWGHHIPHHQSYFSCSYVWINIAYFLTNPFSLAVIETLLTSSNASEDVKTDDQCNSSLSMAESSSKCFLLTMWSFWIPYWHNWCSFHGVTTRIGGMCFTRTLPRNPL